MTQRTVPHTRPAPQRRPGVRGGGVGPSPSHWWSSASSRSSSGQLAACWSLAPLVGVPRSAFSGAPGDLLYRALAVSQ